MTALRGLLILAVVAVLVAVFAKRMGSWLVVDAPRRSDVIVVLAGDFGDLRFERALDLLREGYAPQLVLDADDWVRFGLSDFDRAQAFVREAAPDLPTRVHACSFDANSTVGELRDVAPCLRAIAPTASRAIVVTSNYHTRRALSIAVHALPQYDWSVAAADDPREFGSPWWRNREWAKTTLLEWQKLCWWQLVERWSTRRP